MRRAIVFAGILMMSMSGGCATLLRGTHQTINVKTEPEGATVNVDGKAFTSPADVDLRRKESHVVAISKEGYRTIQFDLDPQWDGVSLVGNMILPGGSIGLIYDSTSGADKNFYALARIDLPPATQPGEGPLVLKDYKGHLLTDEQYDAAVLADRNDRSQFFRGEP
jgi:hypothetical protein